MEEIRVGSGRAKLLENYTIHQNRSVSIGGKEVPGIVEYDRYQVDKWWLKRAFRSMWEIAIVQKIVSCEYFVHCFFNRIDNQIKRTSKTHKYIKQHLLAFWEMEYLLEKRAFSTLNIFLELFPFKNKTKINLLYLSACKLSLAAKEYTVLRDWRQVWIPSVLVKVYMNKMHKNK